jgi:hypothetical protein
MLFFAPLAAFKMYLTRSLLSMRLNFLSFLIAFCLHKIQWYQFICGKVLERVFIVDTEASLLVLLHSLFDVINKRQDDVYRRLYDEFNSLSLVPLIEIKYHRSCYKAYASKRNLQGTAHFLD